MIRQVELEQSVRKIPSSFFMLCLLFGEKPSEGDNIVIDLFLGYRGCGTVRHVQGGSVINVSHEEMDVTQTAASVVQENRKRSKVRETVEKGKTCGLSPWLDGTYI